MKMDLESEVCWFVGCLGQSGTYVSDDASSSQHIHTHVYTRIRVRIQYASIRRAALAASEDGFAGALHLHLVGWLKIVV